MKNSSSFSILDTYYRNKNLILSNISIIKTERNSKVEPSKFKFVQVPKIHVNPFISSNQYQLKKKSIPPCKNFNLNYCLDDRKKPFLSKPSENLFFNSINTIGKEYPQKEKIILKNSSEICKSMEPINYNYYQLMDTNIKRSEIYFSKNKEKSFKFLFSKNINNQLIFKRDLVINSQNIPKIEIDKCTKVHNIQDVDSKANIDKIFRTSLKSTRIPKISHKLFQINFPKTKTNIERRNLKPNVFSSRNILEFQRKTMKPISQTMPSINSNTKDKFYNQNVKENKNCDNSISKWDCEIEEEFFE